MAYALDSTNAVGHAYAMPDDQPKRPRGRPRIHADSKAAASARAAAHVKSKRAASHVRTAYLDEETSAHADALIEARRLASFGALVAALVDEETDRREGGT